MPGHVINNGKKFVLIQDYAGESAVAPVNICTRGVYKCVNIYIYIYCIHLLLYVFMYLCSGYKNTAAYVIVRIHTCVYTYIHIHTNIYIYIYTYLSLSLYICIYI